MLRGAIEESKDILGDTFYKVYTGCKFLNDFYTCNDYKTALRIQDELRLINEVQSWIKKKNVNINY